MTDLELAATVPGLRDKAIEISDRRIGLPQSGKRVLSYGDFEAAAVELVTRKFYPDSVAFTDDPDDLRYVVEHMNCHPDTGTWPSWSGPTLLRACCLALMPPNTPSEPS